MNDQVFAEHLGATPNCFILYVFVTTMQGFRAEFHNSREKVVLILLLKYKVFLYPGLNVGFRTTITWD